MTQTNTKPAFVRSPPRVELLQGLMWATFAELEEVIGVEAAMIGLFVGFTGQLALLPKEVSDRILAACTDDATLAHLTTMLEKCSREEKP